MKTNRSNLFTLIAVAVVSSLATLLIVFGTSNAGARQQQFTGNENHVITLDQAVKLVKNFRNTPSTPTNNGGFLARNIFEKILAQSGCVGIRYYYAKKDDGSSTIVLVGVDANANDLTGGILGDLVWPCPPYCASGPLN